MLTSSTVGISLSCTDMTSDGVEHRTYWYTRSEHPVIDLVRATIVKAGAISTPDGNDGEGTARATFSSPVMSRRHARICFEDDGRVCRFIILIASFCFVAVMHASLP